ncbi:hypothetical protein [Pelobacter propionicus]|nr:hypothetical protein [Pelobacter propionicus]
MKKNMVVGIAMVMGMLSFSAASALAAGSCCSEGKCSDEQVVQQFTRETAGLAGTLKAKDIELRQLYGYDGFDLGKANDLETEIKVLKDKINLVAEKYAISSCCFV